MTQSTYSIAEARNHFAALIHKVERGKIPIRVTRHGEPVAVILSVEEYERLYTQKASRGFWQAYLEYREKWQNEKIDIEDDIWEGVRDKSPGREENPWL